MSGRIRSIKPEVLDDELAASLSDAAWRLWISLWVLADDHGNARAGAQFLGGRVWQDTRHEVETTLEELVASGFVRRYAVRGQRYVHIEGWEKGQRIDNAGKPRMPLPVEDDGSWDAAARGESRRTSATRRASSPSVASEAATGSEGNQGDSDDSAANRGEPPKTSETLGGLPLARSGGRITDHDHDHDHRPRGEHPRDEPVEPEPRPATGPLPKHVVAVERNAWIAAYERAVDTARSGADPFSFPGRAFGALVEVVQKHCQGDQRQAIDAWVGRAVDAFVRAILRSGEDPKLWSDFGPDGLQRWFNRGRPGHAAARTPPAKPNPLQFEKPRLNAPENVAAVEKILANLGKGGPKPEETPGA